MTIEDPGAAPPEAWAPALQLRRFVTRRVGLFLELEAAGGILLGVAAAVAFAWANSPWAASYERLWATPVGVSFGGHAFVRSLRWVVNDGLMTLFFFVVGLEIRSEMRHGELRSLRRAALPLAAALGGMAAPVIAYLALAHGAATTRGWGIPMATDIAFAVGALTLLGRRVPPALKVLLLALAVVDDVGAILVIALGYGGGFAWSGAAVAGVGIALILGMQAAGVRSPAAYVPPAIITWAGTYAAGVHPTLAGVVVGLLTPARPWLGVERFARDVRERLAGLGDEPAAPSGHDLTPVLQAIGRSRREAIAPTAGLLAALHPWTAFAVMPVFALANAGVPLAGASFGGATAPVALGVVAGLLVGKPVGVVLATLGAVRAGIAELPEGVGLRHLLVLGVVAGVGFTMSLFIAQLAFPAGPLLAAAKLGVLAGSAACIALGLALGRALLPDPAEADAPRSGPDALPDGRA